MRDEIRKRAAQAGVSEQEMAATIASGDPQSEALAAEVVASSVDRIARSQSEDRIAELEAELEAARKQLEAERRKHRR